MTNDDLATRQEAAKVWSVWEASTSKLFVSDNLKERFSEDGFADAFAHIECHYFVNQGFLESESQLFDNVNCIRHIPAAIVQGRYDVVCPMMTAWELHKVWPEAEFRVIPDAGHSVTEPGIRSALIEISDRFLSQ